MPLDLSFLSIKRLILHEVYGSDHITGRQQPLRGLKLEELPERDKEAIEKSVVKVLGRKTKSVQLEIEKDDVNSAFQICAGLLDLNDEEFVAKSFDLADSLDKAQGSTNAPGGFVVIFDGITGIDSKRFIAVLKAEKQEGFNRNSKAEGITIQFLEEIFLTDDKKLYKIGLIQENVPPTDEGPRDCDQFMIQVYDHNFRPSSPETAAKYFYNSFLGCKLPKSGKLETKKFWKETVAWANAAELGTEKTVDVLNALNTYLTTNNDEVINVTEFAERHLPEEARKDFEVHMADAMLPSTGIIKDLEFIKTQLRESRYDFGHNIQFLAPSQAFDSKTVEMHPDPDEPGVTIIKVRGTVKLNDGRR